GCNVASAFVRRCLNRYAWSSLTGRDSTGRNRPIVCQNVILATSAEISSKCQRTAWGRQTRRTGNANRRTATCRLTVACCNGHGLRHGLAADTAAVINTSRDRVCARLNTREIPRNVCTSADNSTGGNRVLIRQHVTFRINRGSRDIDRSALSAS